MTKHVTVQIEVPTFYRCAANHPGCADRAGGECRRHEGHRRPVDRSKLRATRKRARQARKAHR